MAMNPAWAIARDNFQYFVPMTFEIIRPGEPFESNWHQAAIAHSLTSLDLDLASRLLLTMPPRCLKSITTSAAWPAFLLGHNPARQLMVISYSEKLARELSDFTRQVMTSPFYRKIFPRTQLKEATKDRLITTANGGRFATTMAGAATGFGADIVIVDDPHNASEIFYPKARQTVKNVFDSTLLTRLNNRERGAIVVVMQRLHEDDLAGHLIGKRWPHLSLPAIATADAEYPIGRGRIHRVRSGDLLHPRRLSRAVLDRDREQMGPSMFEAQYQQCPVVLGGNRIKEAWLRFYDVAPRRGNGQVTISIDTATKTGQSNDYSACTVWLNLDGLHYLTDVRREKVEYTDLKRMVTELWTKHTPDKILVEDTGSGSVLIQELRPMGLPIEGRRATNTKEGRFAAAEGKFSSGKVMLPSDAPWMGPFIAELLAFPRAAHDDQADSVSQYFSWMLENDQSTRFDVFWS